jgi:hypothetical protein
MNPRDKYKTTTNKHTHTKVCEVGVLSNVCAMNVRLLHLIAAQPIEKFKERTCGKTYLEAHQQEQGRAD